MKDFSSFSSKFQTKEYLGASEAATGSPLGIATKLRTPSSNSLEYVDPDTGEIAFQGLLSESDKILIARRARYELQSAASSILYRDDAPLNSRGYAVQHRTCNCTRLSISDGADLYQSKEHKKVHYSGLMKCANSRTCPVCSAAISERKSNEMRVAANMAPALGLHFSLLTFTAPHTASDGLSDLVSKLSGALQRFWRGSPAKKFKERFGIVGHIRSFEIRYGRNGWHPHFHIILVSSHELPSTSLCNSSKKRVVLPLEQQSDVWQWIFNRWVNCCVNEGLDQPNLYGMDLQNGQKAGEYITKFGSNSEILETKTGKRITWDMCDELTKGNIKTSKVSLSPFDILSNYASLSYSNPAHYLQKVKYYSLFNEYADVTKGVSLIKWSRGLRKIFGFSDVELTDDEIISREDDSCDLLCHIDTKAWRFIVKKNYRSLVLELAENGGVSAINEFLMSFGLLTASDDGHSVSLPSKPDDVMSEILKFERLHHFRVRNRLDTIHKIQDSLLDKV